MDGPYFANQELFFAGSYRKPAFWLQWGICSQSPEKIYLCLLNEHKAIETVQRGPEKFEKLSKCKSTGNMVSLTWKNKINKLVISESLGYSIKSLDKFRHNWTILHFRTNLDTLRPIWTRLDLPKQYRAISANLSKKSWKNGLTYFGLASFACPGCE